MPLETNGSYLFGPFTLRVRDKALVAGSEALDLGPMGVDVLMYLIGNRGSVVSRAELARDVWRVEEVSDDAVYRQISDIRKCLDKFDDSRKYIETKHRRGWRFIGTVEHRIELAVQRVTPIAHPVAEQPQSAPRGWSRIAISVAFVLAIAAGAVMVKGMRGSEPRVTGYRQLTNDGFPKDGRVLTDGRLVYFSERVSHDAESNARLASVTVAGSEVVYPPTPLRPGILLDIAGRTGDRVYQSGARYSSGSTLVWRSKEGLLAGLGTDVNEASISPDGRTMAHGDDLHHILSIRDLGAPQSVRNISLQGCARSPRWSGDGRRIRFSIIDPVSRSSSLWEVRRDGSNLHQPAIRAEEGKQLFAEGWTADGRYFIFSEHGELDHHASLWIVPDGPLGVQPAKPVRLTSAAMEFRAAAVAPDDSTIFAIGTKFRNELARFDLRQRAFVPLWGDFPAIDVVFSQDGAWAAFARYPECTLWVSRADGSDRREITWPALEAHQPHWSSDGRQIAFMGRTPGKPWRIYIVNASGGVPQEVKPDDTLDQGVPSWSADGRFLVFGELRERKPDAEMTIRVLDLRTGAETVLPGSKGKWSPRWSPDGRYILAQTTDFSELELFDYKKQTWKSLARAAKMNDATWSLDGGFVHFEAMTEKGQALFRVRVGDGKVEQLALQPEFEYSWAGVAPDGSPLTSRAVKIEEIYALDLKLP